MPIATVAISEARIQFSRFVDRAAARQEIIIAHGGKPAELNWIT